MAKEAAELFITQGDFKKLLSLVQNINSQTAELLEDELNRAAVVSAKNIPSDTVTMNSTVSFEDLETGKESVVTLVFPQDADISQNKVSVLAPIGAALIGLRVGQTIGWPLPTGKVAQLKVISVLYQPEAEGDEP